ncbi:hypothetical protein FHS29_006407 [Saccharothrix tamanrassetensis]|uniref:Uncharacterized protein n=1 Tax=Saccharothrix tamanrassetensis TaxID=1051531 RepID=A0A841CWP7_9PSEU|nr:hypothetical protein [Saccharothrix tamanrassetensis]MBB5959786.1 hypothetical protein [Saccharothrix tamanrassetensis]
MWLDESGASIVLPGLSDLLSRFDAPVAIVELPHIGAAHRFGWQGIDGRLWSVDAESVRGFESHAVARTIRRLGVRVEDTDPDSLLATALGQFLTNRNGADAPPGTREEFDVDAALRATARFMEFGDTVRAEIDAAERTTVRLHVADGVREVVAVHCRDHTGVVTEVGGNTVVAVLPTAHLHDARLGLIAGA